MSLVQFLQFFRNDFSTTEQERLGTGGFTLGLVGAGATGFANPDDVDDERSDSSDLSRSSFDSYFRTGFGTDGNASQFTQVDEVSATPLLAPLGMVNDCLGFLSKVGSFTSIRCLDGSVVVTLPATGLPSTSLAAGAA